MSWRTPRNGTPSDSTRFFSALQGCAVRTIRTVRSRPLDTAFGLLGETELCPIPRVARSAYRGAIYALAVYP